MRASGVRARRTVLDVARGEKEHIDGGLIVHVTPHVQVFGTVSLVTVYGHTYLLTLTWGRPMGHGYVRL